MYPFTIGLVLAAKEHWNEVQTFIHELPARVVLDQPEIGDWPAFLDKLERVRPDIVLLDLTIQEHFDEAVRKIKSTSVAPVVIAIHNSADPETILAAVRAGASEFVYPPLTANLRRALERISGSREKQHVSSVAKGKALAFLSAKGGCGATTLACHTAVELQRNTRQEVLLADFDLETGLVGFLMKAQSSYSVLDAVKNIHRLDHSFWKALVSNGMPGLNVISAPGMLAVQERPGQDPLRYIVRFVRSHYDWTVLDLGRGLTSLSMAALEEVDQAFLVITLEVPALHQAKHMVQLLLDSGFARDKLHLILNRMPKNPEITPDELEKMFGLPVYATLPSDYPALYECYSAGKLLPEGNKLARQFAQLASKIAGIQEEKTRRRFGLFN